MVSLYPVSLCRNAFCPTLLLINDGNLVLYQVISLQKTMFRTQKCAPLCYVSKPLTPDLIMYFVSVIFPPSIGTVVFVSDSIHLLVSDGVL